MSDTAEQNVVNLDIYGHITRGTGNSACAEALRMVGKLATKRLTDNLANMMGKVEDALFARAEMAESRKLQAKYQSVMQAIRDSRKDVELNFSKRFTAQFNQGIPRQVQLGEEFMLASDSEEDQAIADMVCRARTEFSQLLLHLDRRIGFLMHDVDLKQWQNPLCPEAVCAAFRGTADQLDTGLEIRLLIFKLFYQHVVSNLDQLYKEVNQQLVKMGVMPDIKDSSRGDVGTADRPLPAVDQATHQPPVGHDSVTSLPTAPSQPVTSRPNVTSQPPGGHSQTAGRSENVAIDVVAMLFDYILDDKSIAPPMRALLGRLQIPLIKVALLDREFFSKKAHPARRLLNTLAAIAMGWDAEQGHDDPSYRKVESAVQTVVDEFESDISLFITLLADLQSFHDAQEAEARIRAERSVKLMQRQERLESAKSITMKEIEPRTGNLQALEFVREFVNTHWKNLLVMTCARQGKGSDAWKQMVGTMDELIWSVKPKHTDADQQRLAAIQVRLLNELRAGMERLSLPAAERDAFLARLVEAHRRARTGGEALEQTTETRARAAIDDQSAADDGEPEAPRSANGSHEPSVRKIRQLGVGTWVGFQGSNGETTLAKLSWISPINDTYLFTDREGLEIGTYTCEELAQLLRSGRADIL